MNHFCILIQGALVLAALGLLALLIANMTWRMLCRFVLLVISLLLASYGTGWVVQKVLDYFGRG